MDKPVSMLIDEFNKKIVEAISSSKLPVSVIEPIFRNYYDQLRALAEQQLAHDMQEYEKGVEECSE